MFLLTPGKLHPLWYTPYLPVLFLFSAVAAGICMVILVSKLTQRFFKNQSDSGYLTNLDTITLGLGKAAAFVLVTYLALKIVTLAHSNQWHLLTTPYGYWLIVELVVFITLPCLLFIIATRKQNVGMVQFAAVLAVLGVIVNRFTVSLVALNWQLPHREFFDWREFMIVIAVVTVEILVYRWIVNRMPVLRQHPDYEIEDM